MSPAHPTCGEGEERLHRVVTWASSPLAPSIPGILSNTLHCYLMEWGRIFLLFLPHQKGFILVFLVLWTTCNKELWETRCQCGAGGALTLAAGGTEPVLRLLAGVASHPPSRCSFQSPWGMALPASPPQCAHWDIPAPRHRWEKRGHSEINGLELQYFPFLSVMFP